MGARATGVIASAVAWTAFVWVGRIRNALGDDDLRGTALAGVVALSLSFLVPAAAVAVVVWRARSTGVTRLLRSLVMLNLVWAALVWAVRIADIALAGDHDAPFIVVHTALGVVSVALWAWSLVVITATKPENIPVRS